MRTQPFVRLKEIALGEQVKIVVRQLRTERVRVLERTLLAALVDGAELVRHRLGAPFDRALEEVRSVPLLHSKRSTGVSFLDDMQLLRPRLVAADDELPSRFGLDDVRTKHVERSMVIGANELTDCGSYFIHGWFPWSPFSSAGDSTTAGFPGNARAGLSHVRE